jgi:soluble lytic murein transglycosylase
LPISSQATGSAPETRFRAKSPLDAARRIVQTARVRGRWIFIVVVVLVVDLIIGIWWFVNRRDHRHDAVIKSAAQRYGVDPKLVRAVVWRESRFNADARGAAGELGLMQIRNLAAEEWATAEMVEPFDHAMCIDPGTNTLAGTWYLAKLIGRYPHTDNAIVFALADYNAGRTHVLRWAKGPAATNSEAFLAAMTFPGTRKYIETILDRYHDR